MRERELVSLILAGGKGSRLGSLTEHMPKPAVYYGGDYRMIDFPISNCINSGIKTIGVLTQYFSDTLHKYLDNLTCVNKISGVKLLKKPSNEAPLPYMGTADAVYKNIRFIDECNSRYVLILSGDHIYKMNYKPMLEFHKKTNAAVTIASTPVSWTESSQYGILSSNSFGNVYQFEEKPSQPKCNLASMGVYIFTWKHLRKYLLKDQYHINSSHDFGKDIIPAMLAGREYVFTYKFRYYWKDVGTVHELWHSNMDLIGDKPKFRINDENWRIHSSLQTTNAYYYPKHGNISNSLVAKGCQVYGSLKDSVVSNSVIIREGAEVTNSIIMPNVYIGSGVKINKAIIGANAKILNGIKIGSDRGTQYFLNSKLCKDGVSLVAPYTYLNGETAFCKGSHVESTICMEAPFPNPIPHIKKRRVH